MAGLSKARRQSHDRAEVTGAHVVAPISSKDSSAGVECVDRAGVFQDLSLLVKGQYAIVAVVDIEQLPGWIMHIPLGQ